MLNLFTEIYLLMVPTDGENIVETTVCPILNLSTPTPKGR